MTLQTPGMLARRAGACLVAAAMALAMLWPAYATENTGTSAPMTLEAKTERPGGTYEILKIEPPSLEACQQACQNDPKCRAYSYVQPGFQGSKARCWLKSKVMPGWDSDCCTSGVKRTGATPASLTVLENIVDETGAGIDLCTGGGFECGQPVADRICKDKGYAGAVDFRVARNTPPTRSATGDFECTGKFCHRIDKVTCRAEG